MVLDASVIVAILMREPGHELLLQRAAAAPFLFTGAATLVETAMVMASKLEKKGLEGLEHFLRSNGVKILPFTQDHYEVAVSAFLRYGKGRHPAGLNFGDCLSYAMAKMAGMPLLYAGGDFAQTDLG
jgi:ribonuclease VapC